MWNKFKKVDARGRLPKIEPSISSYSMGCWAICDDEEHGMIPIVGVSPFGQIVDDVKSPGCEPYFLVISRIGDIVTDGEKYAYVYNESRNHYSHFIGHRCRLATKPRFDCFLPFTTRDALIIRALIKHYVEAPNVA